MSTAAWFFLGTSLIGFAGFSVAMHYWGLALEREKQLRKELREANVGWAWAVNAARDLLRVRARQLEGRAHLRIVGEDE